MRLFAQPTDCCFSTTVDSVSDLIVGRTTSLVLSQEGVHFILQHFKHSDGYGARMAACWCVQRTENEVHGLRCEWHCGYCTGGASGNKIIISLSKSVVELLQSGRLSPIDTDSERGAHLSDWLASDKPSAETDRWSLFRKSQQRLGMTSQFSHHSSPLGTSRTRSCHL